MATFNEKLKEIELFLLECIEELRDERRQWQSSSSASVRDKLGCPFEETRDRPMPINLEIDSKGANQAGATSTEPRVLGDHNPPWCLATEESDIVVPPTQEASEQCSSGADATEESRRASYSSEHPESRSLTMEDDDIKADSGVSQEQENLELPSMEIRAQGGRVSLEMTSYESVESKPTHLSYEVQESQLIVVEEDTIAIGPCILMDNHVQDDFHSIDSSQENQEVIPNSIEVVDFEMNSLKILELPIAYNVFVEMPKMETEVNCEGLSSTIAHVGLRNTFVDSCNVVVDNMDITSELRRQLEDPQQIEFLQNKQSPISSLKVNSISSLKTMAYQIESEEMSEWVVDVVEPIEIGLVDMKFSSTAMEIMLGAHQVFEKMSEKKMADFDDLVDLLSTFGDDFNSIDSPSLFTFDPGGVLAFFNGSKLRSSAIEATIEGAILERIWQWHWDPGGLV